ncbi:TadE/TadG family type IV pilus assembly protein [Microvirga sp. KLBC 81]|uniref:TadE/TadG family type IV pilus assembly protein n=1 Tax=Microvirga sp. KLBC 81 TaxID=1862707 RepID=UPI001402BD24|nr:TadE family protein [Microvirga sp. KLBC 81]
MKRPLELWQDQSGAALVEAAIVVPVALIVLAGGLELGRAISYHHAADKAVRNAARYIARVPAADVSNDQNAENLVRYGTWSSSVPSGVRSALSPGNVTDVRVVVTDDAATPPRPVRVRLEADVQYSLPLLTILDSNASLSVTVAHEQPYIGE